MCKTSVSRVIFVGFGVALLFFFKTINRVLQSPMQSIQSDQTDFWLIDRWNLDEK